MTDKQVRAQIVVPALSKSLEGTILQANSQQVRVQLDSLDHAEFLKPNHSYAVWITCAKGVYQVSAALVERQEREILLQFRRASKTERRRVYRYPCKMVVEIRSNESSDYLDSWQRAVSTEISHGGMSLTTETMSTPNTLLEVRFWLVGRDTPVQTLARVRHCRTIASNRHIIGLAFEQIPRLDHALLRRMFP